MNISAINDATDTTCANKKLFHFELQIELTHGDFAFWLDIDVVFVLITIEEFAVSKKLRREAEIAPLAGLKADYQVGGAPMVVSDMSTIIVLTFHVGANFYAGFLNFQKTETVLSGRCRCSGDTEKCQQLLKHDELPYFRLRYIGLTDHCSHHGGKVLMEIESVHPISLSEQIYVARP